MWKKRTPRKENETLVIASIFFCAGISRFYGTTRVDGSQFRTAFRFLQKNPYSHRENTRSRYNHSQRGCVEVSTVSGGKPAGYRAYFESVLCPYTDDINTSGTRWC
ncbi:unnamed protein product [Ectocarpus sp. 8 AP-2014]